MTSQHHQSPSVVKEVGLSAYEICGHGLSKYHCKNCGGKDICMHGRMWHRCRSCGNEGTCVCGYRRVNPGLREFEQCAHCYYRANPGSEFRIRVKSREDVFFEALHYSHGVFTKATDATTGMRDGKRTGMMMIKRPDRNIVVECCDAQRHNEQEDQEEHDAQRHNEQDEHEEHDAQRHDAQRHDEYGLEKEMFDELYATQKPLIVIKFNLGGYTGKDGTRVQSCFERERGEQGGWVMSDPLQWEDRIDTLKDTVNRYMSNPPSEPVTVVKLFHDGH